MAVATALAVPMRANADRRVSLLGASDTSTLLAVVGSGRRIGTTRPSSIVAATKPRCRCAHSRSSRRRGKDLNDWPPLARGGLVDIQQPRQRRGQIHHLGLTEVARGERGAQEEDRHIGVIAIEAAVPRAEFLFAGLAPERKRCLHQHDVPGPRGKKAGAMAREAATGGRLPCRIWVRVA